MGNGELELALATLQRDYGKLAARIRKLDHKVECSVEGVVLRVHFPSFRQGQATMHELTDALFRLLVPFSLPRSKVEELAALYGKIEQDEFEQRYDSLKESARNLFKQANIATNRNGEAGELLLYLLTEWILKAPQLIAKMSLKTNPQMPVHGADGVHVRFCTETQRLLLYWGEAKLYSNVDAAIMEAVCSISAALDPKKMEFELDLVERNISFSGLTDEAKTAFLRYLDPFDESYNERHDVTTCLIAFDFDAFAKFTAADAATAEATFRELAAAKLQELAHTVADRVKAAGLAGRPIELFFFPIPSVQKFRDQFQNKIGWKTS